ncbi:zinc finger protein CONSTANS-LIKE 16 [Tripterygium wilfordii]|uniref:Zinc finger protein CONSTANS-LIKE 16 n=1 Tax=Tripterygium wilfordii TaxID=458696 RepID=A0A7J7DZY4_TRIWF|nr:zinc finger protein CONSTANS-LIKE 6-like [Tripterygium wilfordii]KAF5751925.1 zinc finger protein CONSTANS-LIKE 16 [Tripterygium wilfordii]
MISSKNLANAVGGKTARACDSCIKKRARWYCAADDAFLCQACDSSVHSANPLARRHERVRLKTASFKSLDIKNSAPSWHQGFTRKARTPRQAKSVKVEEKAGNPAPLVPEVGSDENSHEEYEEEEQQLLYRVPVYDPFESELCTSTILNEREAAPTVANGGESKDLIGGYGGDGDSCHGFLPSEMDLAEFAADVESLLGRGLENECFGMEELGLMDYTEEDMRECSVEKGKVKLEEEDGVEVVVRERHGAQIDMTREPFELNFDYDSHATCAEEEEKVGFEEKVVKNCEGEEENGGKKKKRKMQLSLDYEGVMTAWASQGCPWTTGSRPDIDECWPDCMGTCGTTIQHPYGGFGGYRAMGDGGREARVSRYREKRRTRLFSKKIRYEVRKLNAEKRPRMKGRFVKRTSFQASC